MKNTFQCVCNKYFEGAYCEAKINVCQNETCSSHGNCVDLNNEPKCECFNLYEGDKCETATSTLQTIKTVVSVSSLIAIGVVIGFYMSIILMDLSKLFSCNKRIKKKKKLTKIHKRLIYLN